MPRSFFGAAIACLALAACKRAAPPLYCSQDLSGLWLNSSDKHFAYELHDDGGVVTGDFKERAEDGGLSKPAEPITFELKRTTTAMAGVMRSRGNTVGGNLCPIEFETRVTDCKPEAVQVAVELSAHVGEDCKRVSPPDGGESASDLREFRLERAQR